MRSSPLSEFLGSQPDPSFLTQLEPNFLEHALDLWNIFLSKSFFFLGGMDLDAFYKDSLNSFFAVFEATESIPLEDVSISSIGPFRSLNYSQWDIFIERLRDGKVIPTCVIDFPYEDKGDYGLNLVGDERYLERMVCFEDTDDRQRRVVLHVSTPSSLQ